MHVQRVTVLAHFDALMSLFVTFFIFGGFLNLLLRIVVDDVVLFHLLQDSDFSLPHRMHNIAEHGSFVHWMYGWIEVKMFWTSSDSGFTRQMWYFLSSNLAKIPIALRLLHHIGHKCKMIRLRLLFVSNQIHIQALQILLNPHITLLNILLKLIFTVNLLDWLDGQLANTHQKWFAILVNHILSLDLLNNALIVLFDKLYQLLSNGEKLLVQKSVKELVPLY